MFKNLYLLYNMQANSKENNIVSSPMFTTTLLLAVILLFLFNFNFDVFNAGAQPVSIVGQGQPGFIPKWVIPVPPSASSLTVNVSNSNYCGSGIHATVNWSYFDPGGSDQTAYEVQIDDDADPLSGQPEWESGTVSSSGTSAATTLCNTANPITSPQTACRMDWNTVYSAWARVRNIGNQWSPWVLMDTYINSGVCSGVSCIPPGAPVITWTTPVHAFPQTGFTFSPSSPSVNSSVTFTDTITFFGAATPRRWVWNFNYPAWPDQPPIDAPPSANGNTVYTYIAVGTYFPRLTATDDLGQSCSYDLVPPVSIQQALPQWREVAPR